MRDKDDQSPAKNGRLNCDIVCAVCNTKRGSMTLEFDSDKDKGLIRALCICENCQGTQQGKEMLQQNNNKSWGAVRE